MYLKSLSLLLLLFLTFSCKKNDNEKEGPVSHDRLRKTKALPADKFIEIATLYKDTIDQGQRGRLVNLTERFSRKIIYHTTNVEHMIYFAAVNGIGTNQLIVILRKENPNLALTMDEVNWINNRWNVESKALLSDDFKRPKLPRIEELLKVKISHKRIDDYEYYVHFEKAEIPGEKYELNPGYIPFYWKYDKVKNVYTVPEFRFRVIQTVGMAKIDLTNTEVDRDGKWINILDHPLFLWKGEVPKWAERTIKNEQYFYDEKGI